MFDLTVLCSNSNALSITEYSLHDFIDLDLSFLQNEELFIPIAVDESVDDFDLFPRLLDYFVDGRDVILFLFVNVSVEIADKRFALISIELCQHDTVISQTGYF